MKSIKLPAIISAIALFLAASASIYAMYRVYLRDGIRETAEDIRELNASAARYASLQIAPDAAESSADAQGASSYANDAANSHAPTEASEYADISAEESAETSAESGPRLHDKRKVARIGDEQLKSMNNDYAGWIDIPDVLSYPVVESDSANKYLDMDFFGYKSKAGTIFHHKTSTPMPESDAFTLYGHSLKNRIEMFSPLLRYKDQAFADQHARMSFAFAFAEEREYTLFAVVNAMADDEEIMTYAKFLTKNESVEYAERMRARSAVECAGEYREGAKFIALTTCDTDYDRKNGRLILIWIS